MYESAKSNSGQLYPVHDSANITTLSLMIESVSLSYSVMQAIQCACETGFILALDMLFLAGNATVPC